MGARRALMRWSWRQFRREWRQQVLILSLVSIATAIAAFFATLIFYTNQPASVFTGTATHRITVFETDLESTLDEIRATFDTIETTGSRVVSRDGSTIEFPISDPPTDSIFGAEAVRLLEGRRPSSAQEVAVTEELATQLDVVIGDTTSIDGQRVTITGTIEDPANLGRSFAIVAPGQLTDPTTAAVLLSAPNDQVVDGFFLGDSEGRNAGLEWLRIDEGAQLVAVSAIFAMASVAMIEVALLCSAGFAVLGQRRLRELGLVSALGASTRNVSQAFKLNGIMIGLAGGVIGVALGFVASLTAQPILENAIGWRIDRWSVPWVAVLPFVVLSGLTGLVGAWLPARSLARVPVVQALAARRPRSVPSGRTGVAGILGFIVGAVALSVGVTIGHGVLAVIGLLVAIMGLLFMTPAVVVSAGRLAPHLPLSPRLALRTIARNQIRSAAAVSALVVALGVPAAVILTSASADANLESGPPNLPNNWVLIWPEGAESGDVPTAFDATEFESDIESITNSLTGVQATPILFAVRPPDPNIQRIGPATLNIVRVARILSDNGNGEIEFREEPAWLATPELLAAVGADPGLASSDEELLGTADDFGYALPFEFETRTENGLGSPTGGATASPIGIDAYRSIGSFWITEQQAIELRAIPRITGWLLSRDSPFLAAEIDALYGRLDSSLVAETQQPNQNNDELRRNTLIVGCLTALAILAVTVTLLRTEASNEDRSLAALGAPRAIRRRVAAATTGFLALGAALLALPAGHLALLAIMSDRTAGYPFVMPITAAATLLLGVPLLGSAAAYLLTSNEPKQLARSPN